MKYVRQEVKTLIKSSIAPGEVQKLVELSSYHGGWSMRALHVNVRVLGSELIAPTLKYLRLRGTGHKSSDEVIIANFVPTVAGTYVVDMRLGGLYPGRFIGSEHASPLAPLFFRE
jgi:hypothetical protein